VTARGKPTRYQRCLLTHAHTPSLPLIPFPMHMFPTWLWRKCLHRSRSQTDARSVLLASCGLFAWRVIVNVVFPRIMFALESVKRERESGRRLSMGDS